MTDNNEKQAEREAFESAWKERSSAHGRSAFLRSEIVPGGYANTRVNDGWAMWQAACAWMAQQAQGEAVATAEDAAAFIDRKAEDYARDFGYSDMGSLSFGSGDHAQVKMDHYTSLQELADEIRGLATPPAAMSAERDAGAQQAGIYADLQDLGYAFGCPAGIKIMDWLRVRLAQPTAAIAAIRKVKESLDPDDWCGDESMIDALERAESAIAAPTPGTMEDAS